MDLALLHLHWTSRKKGGKEYRVYSLARSYRSGGKVRKQIFCKLGKLSDTEIDQWQAVLSSVKTHHPEKTQVTKMPESSPSPEDLTSLIEASSKKRFEYVEVDRHADIELYKKIIQQAFAEVIDPREQENLQYPFYGILLIILAATLAGAKSIRGIYEYTLEKASIFCPLLGMRQPPGYMAFWWIITRANSNMLNQAFARWITSIADALTVKGTKRIAIDGKTLRGAKKNSVHYVSAYDDARGLLLGQVKTQEKSNEITAVPELLKVIDVTDALVTIDAMGCQKEIVRDIRDRGGHYVIALKGNQGNLHAEAKNFFEQALAVGYEGVSCSRISTVDKGHGREEKRDIVITEDLEWLECREEWRDLTALIEIKSTRTINGNTTEECRYYITSKSMKAKAAARAIRSHWGIENKLHWVLDVCFYDDASQANTGHSAENLGLFRRMAYCLLKQDTVKGRGLASKQRKAMWNDNYVLELLGGFIHQTSSTVRSEQKKI
jgi:predicted transposase YbfD/YdcC